MKKLLIGVSALALGLVAASGAWANPKNSFSPNSNATANSAAVNTIGAAAVVGNVSQTAIAESFNVSLEAVSVQTLVGVANGASLTVDLIPIFSGNAINGDITGAAGVAMMQANSGNTSVQQQGVSFAAIGTVNF